LRAPVSQCDYGGHSRLHALPETDEAKRISPCPPARASASFNTVAGISGHSRLSHGTFADIRDVES
jgi:hypothetical protein